MIAAGAHIERGAVVTSANVLDLAPTILYLMGNPVPRDMDGRVLLEIIDATFKTQLAQPGSSCSDRRRATWVRVVKCVVQATALG